MWRAENYYISFGYYEINYHYAVLMIIVQKDFLNTEKMKYNNYKNVFDVFNKHDLVDDIIIPWTRYSGFILYKKYPKTSLLITYKKKYLNIYESKLEKIDDTMNKVIPHSRKKKKVETIDKLDEELETLNFNRFENL
ncbi:MAG: hypothetical protein J1F31_03205 [Erysipelotrichales bacterium]|nr:hypothetical protein [Erysipelotrichales bacterium]